LIIAGCRLARDQAEELDLVAAVDNQPVAEVIRAAIAEHIASRKQNADFQMDFGKGSSEHSACLAGRWPRLRQKSDAAPDAIFPGWRRDGNARC
jgi:hypothetical protein